MPRWRSVWLVARREILERGRSRGFILSVLFTTLIVIGSFIVPAILFGDETGDEGRGRRAGAGRPRGGDRGDRRAVRPERRDHDLSGRRGGRRGARGRTGRRRRRRAGRPVRAGRDPLHRRSPTRRIAQIISAATIGLRGAGRPRRRATSTRPRWRPPSSRRRSTALDPQTEADQARFLVANIGAVLILVGIFSFGFTVLTGVVEEKQSRVVEVVLSTVRPATC